ncbi:hypothetical protein LA080_002858 [Diaporthe eres]|nr:hypothetical protein LA080_002858 [Diaporthe eres]
MSFLAKLDETVVSLNTGPRRIVARNYLLDSEAVQGTASWDIATNRPSAEDLSTLTPEVQRHVLAIPIGNPSLICETSRSDGGIPPGSSISGP